MTENTTTQSEPTEATQADAREIARETMLGDLMQSIIDEMKAMPDVWPKLSESKQDQVIYRVECMSRRVVGKAVEIIAADARPSIATHRAARTDPYEANARLIAAAPELAEALRMVVAAMVDYEMEAETEAPASHREMMMKARAALAKAGVK